MIITDEQTETIEVPSLLSLLTDGQTVGDAPNGALTIREIQDATGWGVEVARREVKRLIDQGQAKVTRKPIINLAGNNQAVPAYQVVTQQRSDGLSDDYTTKG